MKKSFPLFALAVLFLMIAFSGALAQSDLSGIVHRDDLVAVEGVEVQCANCPQTSVLTNADGQFVFEGLLPNTSYTFLPQKDGDDVAGVTILDLCRMRASILGLDPIPNPYRILAADVNQSGSVTTFDMVLISQLILGKVSEFSLTDSWMFDPPSISIDDLPADPVDFVAIKMGDVLREEEVGLASVQPEFSLPTIQANVAGPVEAVVKVKAFEGITGMQFSLSWDPDVLTLNSVSSDVLPGFNQETSVFQPAPGRLNFAWVNVNGGVSLPDGAELLHLNFTALAPANEAQLSWDPNGIPFQVLAEDCQLVPSATITGISTVDPARIFRIGLASNPTGAGELTMLKVESDRPLTIQVRVVDGFGRTCRLEDWQLTGGTSQLALTAPDAPGVYFIHVQTPGYGGQVLKWVVVR